MSVWPPDQALQTHAALTDRVHLDRHRAASAAFPLGLFGVFSIAAAAIASTGNWVALGLYWTIAGIAGGVAIGWWFRRREFGAALSGAPAARLMRIAAAMVAATLLLGWSGAGNATYFAVGCGYVLIALASRNRVTRHVGVAVIAFTLIGAVESWTSLTDIEATTSAVALTLAVASAQLVGAWAEVRRVRRLG